VSSPQRPLSRSFFLIILIASAAAQSPQPYPHAATDRLIRHKTHVFPPPVNVRFRDPDFGSRMVRATDATTHFKIPGGFLRNEASGQANMWSSDTRKFYVVGEGGYEFAFGFDPSTMTVSSLPNATVGQGLLVPLRPESSTFSFVDPDLIYGTTSKNPLAITNYRFSTGVSTTVVDTTTCGTRPSLVFRTGAVVSDDDVSLSADDGRISISEGGPQSGKHPFVIVYDKKLGCRWYNAQTGQIGGRWGASGSANVTQTFLIRHAYLSRSGKYVRILVNNVGWFVWDVKTLNVTACPVHAPGLDCGGYGVVGFNTYVNALGVLDGMNIGQRPLSDLAQITPLVRPLNDPANFDQEKHFTWSNVDAHDSAPVCISTYNYEGDTTIVAPFDGEIACIETDGAASTVWRFAHNRATWVPAYFNTQPLGNISRDGRFFLFTSTWERQLGTDSKGAPRSDVWIVKLE
jgi:hypothetical protein